LKKKPVIVRPRPEDQFRPLVTAFVTVALFVISAYLAISGIINADAWFQTWMQIATTLLGFFFATRSAEKRREDAAKPLS
jgi:hypothetical protein